MVVFAFVFFDCFEVLLKDLFGFSIVLSCYYYSLYTKIVKKENMFFDESF